MVELPIKGSPRGLKLTENYRKKRQFITRHESQKSTKLRHLRLMPFSRRIINHYSKMLRARKSNQHTSRCSQRSFLLTSKLFMLNHATWLHFLCKCLTIRWQAMQVSRPSMTLPVLFIARIVSRHSSFTRRCTCIMATRTTH
jgi:hypothetical protein